MIKGRGLSKVFKIGIIVFVLLFCAGVIYLQSLAGEKKVVVVKTGLTAGTELSSKNVKIIKLSPADRPKGFFSSVEQVEGKTLLADRFTGDFVTGEVVGEVEDQLLAGMARIAICVSKDESSLIRKDDTVSIITFQAGSGGEATHGFRIARIKPAVATMGGQEQNLIILESTTEKTTKIAPYIKSGNFKLIVGDGEQSIEVSGAEAEEQETHKETTETIEGE
ncbi:SAF domain-containing protein [Candidatus Oleimmundimicrobium sp.]|uniref:SAF domain-containing protein n=1 Tax=Candidatus Oleimmundimicrobium sp. TaxID=3060597 RepID=UPI0027195C90|nr:SAF domain-containing protein [Candidatus Oleimmundimicrobium sp.]MDO8886680.1 SAF domain-containing protein [Candidatus Oleimmundimicrobium sp.]